MPLFCRWEEAGILAKTLRKCELKWQIFCFCFLNRPVWAWPGRKNTWFCECHARVKHKYRSWSCCCWRFGKSHSACPSLWLTHPNYSVLTEKYLQIRVPNHPWYSLSWVNLYYWFKWKLALQKFWASSISSVCLRMEEVVMTLGFSDVIGCLFFFFSASSFSHSIASIALQALMA